MRVSEVTKPRINTEHLTFGLTEGAWWGERERDRENGHALGLA